MSISRCGCWGSGEFNGGDGFDTKEEEDGVREASISPAKISIISRRCSNEAGFGALSAFWVARRRRRRHRVLVLGCERRADVAMRR